MVTARASGPGVSISTGRLGGLSARQRYPIFPLHEEKSTLWKEVKLMQVRSHIESIVFWLSSGARLLCTQCHRAVGVYSGLF